MAGRLALGTWQGIYLVEHRARSHRREVMLQFVGTRAPVRRHVMLANVFDGPDKIEFHRNPGPAPQGDGP